MYRSDNSYFNNFLLAVLRHEGDELLHRPLRSVQGARCDRQSGVGQGTRPPLGETKVHVHSRTQETGWSLETF